MNFEVLLLILPPLIFSVTVHEVAHAWVAHREGDPTAAMLGRITLNPLPHLDPVGSLLVPSLLAFMGAPILGWAKPVPVNSRNFRDFKRGDIRVSLAGVVSNFFLAWIFAVLLGLVLWGAVLFPAAQGMWTGLQGMMYYGIQINFVLMLFNLIPVPPLDGSHVFYYLLPPRLGAKYRAIGGKGIFILYAILFLGGLRFLGVPVRALTEMALGLTRLVGPI